jgi:hypothetical protein
MKRLCLAACLCAVGVVTSIAGSAVPPWSIEEYELINDIPGGMTPLCTVRIWDVFGAPITWTNPYDPSVVLDVPAGTAYGTCIFQFTNKVSDFKIIFPQPTRFHALGQGGGPLEVLYVYDDKHHSRDRAYVGMFIKPNLERPEQSLKKGDTTMLIADGNPDGNVYIDVRPAE